MGTNTEEIFKSIIKNACTGLAAIVNEDKSLDKSLVHDITMFLADMKVNYFNEAPETLIQEELKASGGPINTEKAIIMLAGIISKSYKELK
jgi:hypothetical protein